MGRSEEITGLKYDKSLYTDCGFYAGDMDDSYIEEEEKLIKCRKPHKCSACQRDINKGEYMETKKYIIEIPDNTAWLQWVKVSDKDGHVCFDFKDPEDLTPYTEPRKESCDKCMNEVEDLAYQLYSVKVDEAYQRGLNDAWDAARKIVLSREDGGLFGYEERKAVFGCGNYMALKTFLAPEAIEKIRQYEQKKEERITKGDVVRIKSAPEIEIFVTYADGEYVGGIALTEMDDSCKIGDRFTDIAIHKVEKTGRHYEIAEVFKKMQEEES